MNQELSLRIVLQNPPAGVDFGLQKGHGREYATVQTQRSNRQSLHFSLTVTVKRTENKDQSPSFRGIFVQGPPNAQFIYPDIGTAAGQADSVWSRRLKIPLQGISGEMIDQLQANAHPFLEAHIPGTGKDGGPTCGTVKPFSGWCIGQPV